MLRFNLANGGTVEFTRMGIGYEVHLRNPQGQTTSTVHVSDEQAHDLMGAAE